MQIKYSFSQIILILMLHNRIDYNTQKTALYLTRIRKVNRNLHYSRLTFFLPLESAKFPWDAIEVASKHLFDVSSYIRGTRDLRIVRYYTSRRCHVA